MSIKVGADPDAYQRIEKACSNLKKGSYLRVIMINPLHKRIPKLVIFISITCNMFDHRDVKEQWNECKSLYAFHLEEILGPVVGNSSDGDSRRRKLMMSSGNGKEFQPINKEDGFLYAASVSDVHHNDEVHYCNLSDQDAIHNHKKLINPLEHPSRVLRVGKYMVHSSHLQIVRNNFPLLRDYEKHRLRENDVTHRDRQNWESAQRISAYCVQDCLSLLVNGSNDLPPQPNLLGTKIYLEITAKYVDIFFSPALTNENRVRYASCVANFLSLWHNYISGVKDLTLKENFITRESFTDIVISCHFIILLMCEFRDHFPDQPLDLSLTGSQCLEDLFSEMVSWNMNKHTFSGMEALRTLRSIATMQKIKAAPDAPHYSRSSKQEDIWYMQYLKVPYINPTLNEFPDDIRMEELWKQGLQDAQEMAWKVGIAPSEYKDNESTSISSQQDLPSWFAKPLAQRLSLQKLSSEEENEEMRGTDAGTCIETEESETDNDTCGEILVRDNENDIIQDEIDEFVVTDDEFPEEAEKEKENNGNSPSSESSITVKHSNQIQVPGVGLRYKSTVVSMFATDQKLALDRLKRVRQRQYTQTCKILHKNPLQQYLNLMT
eukprot:Seg1182.1 transcript_id=Seg1182.1/GoldUCD/mRNA.D3Y31 product="hypothetical protein" protein_id=Seg1182.1/GoldUCD/D3Y31